MSQKTNVRGETKMMCFSENLATMIGFLEAVIVERIKFSMRHKSNKNVIKGVNWVYNTYEQWQAIFPFASKRSIERAFAKLEKIGILKSGYFCRNKTNRTKWYTVDQAVLSSFDIGTSCQIGGMDDAKRVENDTKLAGCITPNWRDPLSQEIHNNNTNNNNTKVLGRTKYWGDIAEFNSKFVVVPTDYNSFDNLPKLEVKEKNVVLEEKIETSDAVKVQNPIMNKKQSRPNFERTEIEIEELPLSIVQKMKDVNFDGSYMRLRILKWVKQFREDYVLEKISLLRNTKFNKPGAVLTEAIKWDWKEIPKFEKTDFPRDESTPFCKVVENLPKLKPKLSCGVEWWEALNEDQRRKVVDTMWNKWTVNDFGYDARKSYYDSNAFLCHEHFRDICESHNKQPPEKRNINKVA